MNNAIGIVEFNSVARGIYATDQMIKASEIEIVTANTVCPGKYIAVIHGDVSSVKNSVELGVDIAEEFLVDSMLVPQVSPLVFPAIAGTSLPEEIDALGIIETFSIASIVVTADAVLKSANLEAIDIRLGTGLGGKSYFIFTGDVGAVNAGIEVGREMGKESGLMLNCEVIPSPTYELIESLL